MDQRAHDVEEDLKQILQTRESLGHKIELLEKRVDEAVQGTKAVALAVLDFASHKAVDFIESAVYQMNPRVQAAKRPWFLLGGAIASGFIAGLMTQRRRASGIYPYYPPKAEGADVMPSQEREQTGAPIGAYPLYTNEEQLSVHPTFSRLQNRMDSPRSKGWISDLSRLLLALWDDLAGELTEERLRLQSAALYAGRSFIRDVARSIGQYLLEQLNRPRPMSQRHGQPRDHK